MDNQAPDPKPQSVWFEGQLISLWELVYVWPNARVAQVLSISKCPESSGFVIEMKGRVFAEEWTCLNCIHNDRMCRREVGSIGASGPRCGWCIHESEECEILGRDGGWTRITGPERDESFDAYFRKGGDAAEGAREMTSEEREELVKDIFEFMMNVGEVVASTKRRRVDSKPSAAPESAKPKSKRPRVPAPKPSVSNPSASNLFAAGPSSSTAPAVGTANAIDGQHASVVNVAPPTFPGGHAILNEEHDDHVRIGKSHVKVASEEFKLLVAADVGGVTSSKVMIKIVGRYAKPRVLPAEASVPKIRTIGSPNKDVEEIPKHPSPKGNVTVDAMFPHDRLLTSENGTGSPSSRRGGKARAAGPPKAARVRVAGVRQGRGRVMVDPGSDSAEETRPDGADVTVGEKNKKKQDKKPRTPFMEALFQISQSELEDVEKDLRVMRKKEAAKKRWEARKEAARKREEAKRLREEERAERALEALEMLRRRSTAGTRRFFLPIPIPNRRKKEDGIEELARRFVGGELDPLGTLEGLVPDDPVDEPELIGSKSSEPAGFTTSASSSSPTASASKLSPTPSSAPSAILTNRDSLLSLPSPSETDAPSSTRRSARVAKVVREDLVKGPWGLEGINRAHAIALGVWEEGWEGRGVSSHPDERRDEAQSDANYINLPPIAPVASIPRNVDQATNGIDIIVNDLDAIRARTDIMSDVARIRAAIATNQKNRVNPPTQHHSPGPSSASPNHNSSPSGTVNGGLGEQHVDEAEELVGRIVEIPKEAEVGGGAELKKAEEEKVGERGQEVEVVDAVGLNGEAEDAVGVGEELQS